MDRAGRRRGVARLAVVVAALAGSVATPDDAAAVAVTTSCRAVAHIGDSISVGLDEEPYRTVGVSDVRLEVSGARSSVERRDGLPNAVDVARDLRDEGFDGCWVIAIGTNDAANVAAGSGYGASERIDRVMEVVGTDPVLWVDVQTETERGFYAREHMGLFNQALAKAHARHPTLQVFAWSEVARDPWFSDDGIHYTDTGYAERFEAIAEALAETFPARRTTSSSVPD